MRGLVVVTIVYLSGCGPECEPECEPELEKVCEEMGEGGFRDPCQSDCDCVEDMFCFSDPGDDSERCCGSSEDSLDNGWGVDCEITGFGF